MSDVNDRIAKKFELLIALTAISRSSKKDVKPEQLLNELEGREENSLAK
jgi:hypothetical protein